MTVLQGLWVVFLLFFLPFCPTASEPITLFSGIPQKRIEGGKDQVRMHETNKNTVPFKYLF